MEIASDVTSSDIKIDIEYSSFIKPFLDNFSLKHNMPENLTDRNRCHKCDKTGKRKKDKLSKCAKCQAITYCSRECQAEDWPRHKENCVPVMVTEVEEKGRGLVAARDIKMGEEILIGNTVISLELPDRALTWPLTPTIARSLKQQIEVLPEEKVTQFYNLKIVDNIVFSERDLKIARRENCLKEWKIFRSNNVELDKKEVLIFNFALINHSCMPNVEYCIKPSESEDQKKVEAKYELRAIKDISKSEEITIFYMRYLHGVTFKNVRRSILKDNFGFDCKCNVCCGKVDDQDSIIQKLVKIVWCSEDKEFVRGTTKKFNYSSDEWKKVGIKGGIVLTLSQDLYIGNLWLKVKHCACAVFAAQMARDPVLLEKAMSAWKELVMKTGFEKRIAQYKEVEEKVAKWSPEFNSKKLPTKEEIVSFENLFCNN